MTEIETRIMSQLFQRTLESFQEAWSSVVELDPQMEEIEVNPQFIQMVSPNETVVVISLSTTIGEASGMINICLPPVVLEDILPKLSVHYWMQTKKKSRLPEEVEALEKNVRSAPLTIKAELGNSEISIQEFLQLDIGDIIELDQLIDQPLLIKIEDAPKYFGQPGKIKNHIAVQVTELIEEDEENE